MARKYLDNIVTRKHRPDGWCRNKIGKRRLKWWWQRHKYGFDSKETWNLDYSFYLWLYERLLHFVEVADDIINLEYNCINFEGIILNQKQCIERMIEGCKLRITKDELDLSQEEIMIVEDVASIWALILPFMWW